MPTMAGAAAGGAAAGGAAIDGSGAATGPPTMDRCAQCGAASAQLLACDDPELQQTSPTSASKPRFCNSCMIGKKVRVFWPVDESWYTGTVQEFDASTGEHLLCYPDGDTEWVKIGDIAGAGGSPEDNNIPPPLGTPAGGDNNDPTQQMPGSGGVGAGITADGHHKWSPDQHASMMMAQQRAGAGHPGEMGFPGGHNGTPYGGGAAAAAAAGGMMHHPHHGMSPHHPHHPAYGHHPHHAGGAGAGMYPYGAPASMYHSPYGEHHMPHHHHHHGMMDHDKPRSADTGAGRGRKTGHKAWSKEEDALLLSIVQNMQMPMKWSLVAQSLPDRTGKQCRERYVNHLNPRLKVTDWNPCEDSTIFHLYNTIGSHWAKMSKVIPGRTDNGIKNRFHNLRRQFEREDEHRLRLSSANDFPSEIRLDRMRKFPNHLKGKAHALWDMKSGIGVLAAQSILDDSTTSANGRSTTRFGPFRRVSIDGSTDDGVDGEVEEFPSCTRCGFLIPSVHTGNEVCTKTGWCESCTRIPPHICHNLLRECLNLRRVQDEGKRAVVEAFEEYFKKGEDDDEEDENESGDEEEEAAEKTAADVKKEPESVTTKENGPPPTAAVEAT